MVSFQCDGCGDVVKKPKLNQHGGRCHATFTCIDCSVTFQGNSYQSHNSCMTEAQKFQKHIYNGDSQKNNQKTTTPPAQQQKKPISIVAQLQKRNIEEVAAEPEKKEKKEKKVKLSAWSDIKLDKDLSNNLEFALKHILKEGKPLKLKDVRKKTIKLIEKHPKYTKSEDLKKEFDKKFTLVLKDNSVTFE